MRFNTGFSGSALFILSILGYFSYAIIQYNSLSLGFSFLKPIPVSLFEFPYT